MMGRQRQDWWMDVCSLLECEMKCQEQAVDTSHLLRFVAPVQMKEDVEHQVSKARAFSLSPLYMLT